MIKRKVGLLRQLVQKLGAVHDGEREEEDFGGVISVGSDGDDVKSICTIILHELERVEKDNK